jgi:hypothetical protein
MQVLKQSGKSKKQTIYLMDLEEPGDIIQTIHKALAICSNVFRGLPIGFEHFDDPATTEKFIFHSLFYTTIHEGMTDKKIQILDAVLFQPTSEEWIEWKKLKETERQSDQAWAKWTKSQRYINISQLQHKFRPRFNLCFGKSTKILQKSTHFFKSDQTKDEIDKIFGFPQNKKTLTKKNSVYAAFCAKIIREKPKTESDYKKLAGAGGPTGTTGATAEVKATAETKGTVSDIFHNVANEESAARLIYKRGLEYYLSRTTDEIEIAETKSANAAAKEKEIKTIIDSYETKFQTLGTETVQDPKEIPYEKWNQSLLDRWFARPYRNELNDPSVEDVISYRKQGIDHDFGFLIQWKRPQGHGQGHGQGQTATLIRTWHVYSLIKNVTGFQEVLQKAGFDLQAEISRLMFVECHNPEGGFTDDEDEDGDNCLIKNKVKNSKISAWKEYPLKSSEQLLIDDFKKMKPINKCSIHKYVTNDQFEKEEIRFRQEDDKRVIQLTLQREQLKKETQEPNQYSILERVKRLVKLSDK